MWQDEMEIGKCCFDFLVIIAFNNDDNNWLVFLGVETKTKTSFIPSIFFIGKFDDNRVTNGENIF